MHNDQLLKRFPCRYFLGGVVGLILAAGVSTEIRGEPLTNPSVQETVETTGVQGSVLRRIAIEGRAAIFLWSVDLRRLDLVVSEQQDEGGTSVRAAVEREHGVLGVNAGYFKLNGDVHAPAGLLVVNGRRTGDVASSLRLLVKSSQGKGSQGWDVLYPQELGLQASLEFALQSRPIVVDRPGKIGVSREANELSRRTAICVGKDMVVLIATDDPLTLYDLGSLLVDQNAKGNIDCPVALALDGGPSTGMYATNPSIEVHEQWKVENVLVVRPKP